jgi:hypothetical protein
MLGDRRLPFEIEFDQPGIKTQLRPAEVNHFLEELEGLLLRKAIEEPDEGDLVGKAEPVMTAPALAELLRRGVNPLYDATDAYHSAVALDSKSRPPRCFLYEGN